jgi:hypothetical protein
LIHQRIIILNKLSVVIKSGVIMKITLMFFPTILIALILGIGFRKDYQKLSEYGIFQPVNTNDQIRTTIISPIEAVWAMIGQINQERVLTDLRRLTGEEQICLVYGCYTINNRLTGSQGLQWAKDYIYEQLVSLGYSVELQNWSSNGNADQNLIIRKSGMVSPGEEIYFVAHIDGVNNSPAADDNASGVVSLLELARILRSRAISSTVVLLFSTGEEQGALGVQSYVDQLTPEELAAIKDVVDVDMLGYDANNDGVMELFNGNQPVDFVQLLTDIISTYQINLIPQIVSDCG